MNHSTATTAASWSKLAFTKASTCALAKPLAIKVVYASVYTWATSCSTAKARTWATCSSFFTGAVCPTVAVTGASASVIVRFSRATGISTFGLNDYWCCCILYLRFGTGHK